MQFFGDVPERAWVKEPSTREFQGIEEFELFCEKMIASNKKDKAKYIVAPRKQQAWSIAVVAAEGALPKSRDERRQDYTFMYEPPKPKDAVEKTPNGVVRKTAKPKQVSHK